MGKLYLYYKKHDEGILGNILKVKIDDSITFEVPRDEIYELELVDGKHNVKMYYEGWSKNELVGYLDNDIEINGNTYFTYKGPFSIYGKAKLIKNCLNTPEEFYSFVKKGKKNNKIIGIIFLIIAILVYILIQ